MYRYTLLVVVIAATALRFWHIGNRSLWYDEGYTWGVTNLPWAEFFHGLATRAGDMSLYYILFKLWKNIGDSETTMRVFSALFSIATVPVIAELGKQLWSRKAGAIAAALFAAHVFVIRYAQENRPYAMVGFLAALGWLQLVRAVRQPTMGNWLLFSLISLASVYTHFIVGLNVLAQATTLLVLKRGQLPRKPVIRAALVFTGGTVPALMYASQHSSDLVWIRPVTLRSFFEFLRFMTGESAFVAQIGLFALVFVVLMILCAKDWLTKGRGFDLWASTVPVIGLAFPIVALWLISLYRPVFVPRYLLFTAVPLLLGVAHLLSRWKNVVSAGASAVLVVLLLAPLPGFYRESSSQDFRGAVAHIQQQEHPGDGILIWEPMGRATVDYYGRHDVAFPKVLFPVGERFQALDVIAMPDPYTFPQVVASYKHLWIVYTFEMTAAKSGLIPALYLQRITERTHRLISVRQFKGLRVEEYSY